VIETLDFLIRFWELRARFEQCGDLLSEAERLELLSLFPLVTGAAISAAPDCSSGQRRGIPVQLTAGNGFLAADVRELRADGLVVGAAEPIDPGSRTMAYFADAVSGIEYSLPCVVAWALEAEPWIMGLALDGLPTRAELLAPVSALLRSPLGHHPGEQVQA
jgi:hypothetical protein